MKKEKLSASDFVREMHKILREFDYSAQRDAILDIADLLKYAEEGAFTLFWGVRLDGTHLSRVNNFGYFEPMVSDRFRVAFDGSDWSIERIEK